MGRQEYLIDTNVAIEYIGEALPEKALAMLDGVIDGHFYISVMHYAKKKLSIKLN